VGPAFELKKGPTKARGAAPTGVTDVANKSAKAPGKREYKLVDAVWPAIFDVEKFRGDAAAPIEGAAIAPGAASVAVAQARSGAHVGGQGAGLVVGDGRA